MFGRKGIVRKYGRNDPDVPYFVYDLTDKERAELREIKNREHGALHRSVNYTAVKMAVIAFGASVIIAIKYVLDNI